MFLNNAATFFPCLAGEDALGRHRGGRDLARAADAFAPNLATSLKQTSRRLRSSSIAIWRVRGPTRSRPTSLVIQRPRCRALGAWPAGEAFTMTEEAADLRREQPRFDSDAKKLAKSIRYLVVGSPGRFRTRMVAQNVTPH